MRTRYWQQTAGHKIENNSYRVLGKRQLDASSKRYDEYFGTYEASHISTQRFVTQRFVVGQHVHYHTIAHEGDDLCMRLEIRYDLLE
jgi:hypothetical protein